MNVDFDVIKKEIEYITLRIYKCHNMYELNDLIFTFGMLNVFYKHYTGESLEEPKTPFISDRVHLEYCAEIVHEDEIKLLNKYESEKNIVLGALSNYVENFNSCSPEVESPNIESIVFSEEDAKNIILDFFSKYDDAIYNIVKLMFDNKQIQTGIENFDSISLEESKLFHFLDTVYELECSDFTKKTIKPFVKKLLEVGKKCDTAELKSQECVQMLNELKDLYDKLVPIRNDYIKKSIDFDEVGDKVAFTYRSMPLEKVYVLVNSDKLDTETIISIVHELGHAIEDYTLMEDIKKRRNSDSAYLAEVASSFFEYEFIKYLIENNIDKDYAMSSLYIYHLDCADDSLGLLDTLDCTPDLDTYGENIDYVDNEGERFTIDIQNRVKYGYNKYIAMLLSKKSKENPENFTELLYNFMRNRENLSSIELLEQLSISESEFNDASFLEGEVLTLIKKYDI